MPDMTNLESVWYEWLGNQRGCLLARRGRGDCLNYLGVPETLDERTTDMYGRPYGWCQVCWDGFRITELEKRVIALEGRDA
jgi:hypothetical protein